VKLLHGLLVALALAGGMTAAAETPPPPPATPATPDPGDVTQPNEMIRDLYTRYFAALTKNDADQTPVPPELGWEAIADTYFTPDLAARFKKAINSEEPVIDWDFFINGQDYQDLKLVSVATVVTGDTSAVVTVVASNFGNESTTIVNMVKTASGWRIADFVFVGGEPEGLSLSSVLKDAGY
jgi:hypothetical protein